MFYGTRCFWAFAMLACAAAACGGNDSGAASNEPKIVGCNSVQYAGCTFDHLGCAPGVASFDADITVNNCHGSFHVVCSSGCVKSVTPK